MKKMIKSALVVFAVALIASSALAAGQSSQGKDEGNVLSVEKIVKTYGANDSTATVQIVTHFNDPPVTNKILYVGSMCYRHVAGQESQQRTTIANVINGTIQNLVAKGDVDVYLFGNTAADAGKTDTKVDPQHLKWKDAKSIKTYQSNQMIASGHANLLAYLTTLSNQLSAAEYDFVVLSMDCSRVCDGYPTKDGSDEGLRREVATRLKPLYEAGHVIWVVDSKFEGTDVYPGEGVFYRPSNVYKSSNSAGDDAVWPNEAWCAFCAMMDPKTYLDDTKWVDGVPCTDNAQKTLRGKQVYAADRIDNQTTYDALDNVTKILDRVIEIPSFTETISDQINANLDVTAARVYTSDTELAPDAEGWTLLTGAASTKGGVQVATVAGITNSLWTKFEIDVKDTEGKFLVPDATQFNCVSQSEDKVSFFFDPNVDMEDPTTSRGPVVALVTNETTKAELASASAETSKLWKRSLRSITINVTDYNNPYNAQSTNVLVSVDPVDPAITLKAQYSTDGGATWSKEEDYTTAKFKDVVDGAKVRIIASGLWYQTTTNDTGTVTITPLDITVTAGNGSKVYDGAAADLSATTWSFSGTFADGEQDDIEALISAGITNTQGKTMAFVLKDGSVNAGTYDITTNKILTANQNYNVNFTPGIFTINPAQILGFDFSNTKGYNAAATPKALAKNVDCFVEDLKGGTKNIETSYAAFGKDTFDFTFASPEGFSDVGVHTNTCTVSGGDNYLSTNITAEVIIRKREPEVAGDTKAANEADVMGTLLEIAQSKANGKTPKPVYAEARLTIDSATGGGDETDIKNEFLTKTGDAVDVNCASYDIKLEYTEDYKDPKHWDDIGSSNNTKIKIVLDCPVVKGAEKVEVWRKHNGMISKAKDWPDGNASVDKGKGQVTINVSKFSVYTVITYSIPPPPPSKGCDWNPEPEVVEGTAWVYNWKFSGKTAVGAKTTIAGADGMSSACEWNPGVDAQGCVIRVAGALAIRGYTYLCEPECSMEDFNMFKDAAWTFGHKGWSFYMTKPYKDIVSAEISDTVANVIGREGGKFELAGTATFVSPNLPAEEFALTFAGFGKYNASKKCVTSVSGKFAGTAKQPYYVPTAAEIRKAKRNLCAPAIVWDCAVANWIDDDDTSVAYGNFSVKLDASASKKFYKNGSVVQLPDWAEALIKAQY